MCVEVAWFLSTKTTSTGQVTMLLSAVCLIYMIAHSVQLSKRSCSHDSQGRASTHRAPAPRLLLRMLALLAASSPRVGLTRC